MPADVAFRRVHVGFNAMIKQHQKLFYALEAMGKVDEMQSKVFREIHVNRQPTDREDRIVAFVEKNGIDRAKFQELYNSFQVATKARKARQLQDEYQVDGVPALGVAGRFYTDGTLAGGMDQALQVVDYLVAQVRSGK